MTWPNSRSCLQKEGEGRLTCPVSERRASSSWGGPPGPAFSACHVQLPQVLCAWLCDSCQDLQGRAVACAEECHCSVLFISPCRTWWDIKNLGWEWWKSLIWICLNLSTRNWALRGSLFCTLVAFLPGMACFAVISPPLLSPSAGGEGAPGYLQQLLGVAFGWMTQFLLCCSSAALKAVYAKCCIATFPALSRWASFIWILHSSNCCALFHVGCQNTDKKQTTNLHIMWKLKLYFCDLLYVNMLWLKPWLRWQVRITY